MTRLLPVLLMLPALVAIAGPDDPWFSCRSCHGDMGLGSPAIRAPALAGQDASYTTRQLKNFRDGVRGAHPEDTWGQQMALMAANLDDRAIEDVATQVAAMAPPAPSGATGTLPQPDSYLACTTCHGKEGQGRAAAMAPRIAGLDPDYIATQLRNFRDGIRGYRADDIAGRQMGAAALGLSDPEITALAEYLRALPPGAALPDAQNAN